MPTTMPTTTSIIPSSKKLSFETSRQNTNSDGWLAVSTEGFAQQNAARPYEHLVKELVQNALDALENLKSPKEQKAEITLQTQITTEGLWVICQDTGEGIEDMDNLRTVFWTSKQDSHTKRGRMGRGFKEMLCLSLQTLVESKNFLAHFHYDEIGKRSLTILKKEDFTKGTKISMLMPWKDEGIEKTLKSYFSTFLIPTHIDFKINNTKVEPKAPTYTIGTSITTEAFDNGRWVKPSKKTQINLIRTSKNEVGLIYEMGIPVCPAEWDIGFHVDIQQRVPMNPNRDAVASGYASKIHKACLPTLLPILKDESARSSWVGEAAAKSNDPILQKKILEKAFGTNLARSVPGFGKFNHDAAAEEEAGVKILDTKQLSGGFREMVKTHIPTSKDVAEQARRDIVEQAAAHSIDLNKANDKAQRLINKYGKEKISAICGFHQDLANRILKKVFGSKAPKCTVKTALMDRKAEATWSHQFSIFTLALDFDRIWSKPFDRENFALHIHETAHELAAHHGNSFARAMEVTAGAACETLLNEHQDIQTWQKKIEKL